MTAAHPNQWLRPEDVTLDFRAGTKRELMERIAHGLALRLGAEEQSIFDALQQRERLGSTALGHGVALPHARVPDLAQPVGVFFRLSPAVAFDAPDDKPVLFVLGLLLPQTDPTRQLTLLAHLAERFSRAELRNALANAADPAFAWRLLAEEAWA